MRSASSNTPAPVDAMGPEFTLLRFNSAADVAALELAARDRGVPLKVVDVERPTAANSITGWCCCGRTSMWPGAEINYPLIRWL